MTSVREKVRGGWTPILIAPRERHLHTVTMEIISQHDKLWHKIMLNSMYGKLGSTFMNYEVLSRNIVSSDPIAYTYSVKTIPSVLDWLQENYISGEDYWVVRRLTGVWIDMTEETFIMLKLKWTS